MPTPRSGYQLNGKRIPSVTTILAVGLGGYSKDPLMKWAWSEGMAGRDYRESRQKAADAGTLAHAMIQRYLEGGDPYAHDEALLDVSDELMTQADTAFGSFLDWRRDHELTIDEQEFPLVCPTHGFGGTPDARGTLDGVYSVLDWKSSGGLYESYVAQVAAYHWLMTANRRGRAEQAVIVRCGKDGTFRVVTLDARQISYGWSVFLHALAIYQAKTELAAMVREPVAAEPRITRLPVTRKATA
jgi:hypothetical protein